MVSEGNLTLLAMLWDILTEWCLELIMCIRSQLRGDLKCVAISPTYFVLLQNLSESLFYGVW